MLQNTSNLIGLMVWPLPKDLNSETAVIKPNVHRLYGIDVSIRKPTGKCDEETEKGVEDESNKCGEISRTSQLLSVSGCVFHEKLTVVG